MSLKVDDALANLAAVADTLPKPYLVTGPQAAYLYHGWLQPISKMIDIAILPEHITAWQTLLQPPWTVLTQTPTFHQAQQATRIAILVASLADKQYARRITHQGLAFISPEDLCIDLLRRAKTQIGLSEIAALLIKQKDRLDWSYLIRETNASWLGYRLQEIVQKINLEADHRLLPAPDFETTILPPPNVTSIHPDSLKDVLRPFHARIMKSRPH